jgi:hypothetical protein
MNEFVQGNINFFLGACVGVAATAIVAFVALKMEYQRGVDATLRRIYGAAKHG